MSETITVDALDLNAIENRHPLAKVKETARGDFSFPESEAQFVDRMLVATRAAAKKYYADLIATGAIPSRQRIWYDLRIGGLGYSQISRLNIESSKYGTASVAGAVEAYAKKHGLPVPEDSTVEDHKFYRKLKGPYTM